MLKVLRRNHGNEFPGGEYAVDPVYPFKIDFVTPRSVRLRMTTGPQAAHRKVFNGKALAIVQSDGNAGEITFEAKSENLQSERLIIRAIN